ncbi:MAG: alpha/beta fold hydrolase [Ktedonobacteraceae bacterium]
MGKGQSKYVVANGIKTHYIEAGAGPALVLLHSGEYGGSAETTWEFNIDQLSEHFHVLAPDWLGYGKTEKLFDFTDMWQKRVNHIRAFIDALCIEKAHFVGNSMGGSMLITVAAMDKPIWPMDCIVIVSGGGYAPENEERQVLNSYDLTRAHMQRIIKVLYLNPRIRSDKQYLEKRYQASLEPGAWECTAAVRFKAPGRESSGAKRPASYRMVRVPTMLIAGEKDNLRQPGYAQALQEEIPGACLKVIKDAGHCPQVDQPDIFNRLVVEFLKGETR